jgi:hypothetical protein
MHFGILNVTMYFGWRHVSGRAAKSCSSLGMEEENKKAAAAAARGGRERNHISSGEERGEKQCVRTGWLGQHQQQSNLQPMAAKKKPSK